MECLLKFFTILVLLFSQFSMANPIDAEIETYDGMIHLQLSGELAQKYYDSIKKEGEENDFAIVKSLNENVNCVFFKRHKKYMCALSFIQN